MCAHSSLIQPIKLSVCVDRCWQHTFITDISALWQHVSRSSHVLVWLMVSHLQKLKPGNRLWQWLSLQMVYWPCSQRHLSAPESERTPQQTQYDDKNTRQGSKTTETRRKNRPKWHADHKTRTKVDQIITEIQNDPKRDQMTTRM